MTLPKNIDKSDFDLLIQEAFECWLEEGNRAFPSEEWFDNVWIHDPQMRDRLTRLFSDILVEFNEGIEKLEASDAIRTLGYDKISYCGETVCIEKRLNAMRIEPLDIRIFSSYDY